MFRRTDAGGFMDINDFFELKSDQILDSKSFDEARDYLAFFLGAYAFAQQYNLLTIDQNAHINDMVIQLSEFVSDNWS